MHWAKRDTLTPTSSPSSRSLVCAHAPALDLLGCGFPLKALSLGGALGEDLSHRFQLMSARLSKTLSCLYDCLRVCCMRVFPCAVGCLPVWALPLKELPTVPRLLRPKLTLVRTRGGTRPPSRLLLRPACVERLYTQSPRRSNSSRRLYPTAPVSAVRLGFAPFNFAPRTHAVAEPSTPLCVCAASPAWNASTRRRLGAPTPAAALSDCGRMKGSAARFAPFPRDPPRATRRAGPPPAAHANPRNRRWRHVWLYPALARVHIGHQSLSVLVQRVPSSRFVHGSACVRPTARPTDSLPGTSSFLALFTKKTSYQRENSRCTQRHVGEAEPKA